MSHEVTDVLLIHHSRPTLTLTLPFGSTTIARRIERKLNIPLSIAYSYLSLFSSGSLDEETTKTLNKIIEDSEKDWQKLWATAEESLVSQGLLPQKAFIAAGKAHTDIGKIFLEGVLAGGEVTVVGDKNRFTDEAVKVAPTGKQDEALNIIAAHLNTVL